VIVTLELHELFIFPYFYIGLKKNRSHITQILTLFLIWTFAITVIPWAALHHHQEEQEYCAKEGKICMHKTHVGNEQHNCLICSAHFIKDYHTAAVSFQVRLQSKLIARNYTPVKTFYTALIRSSLRGPPAA
jgi:hypothetical protein